MLCKNKERLRHDKNRWHSHSDAGNQNFRIGKYEFLSSIHETAADSIQGSEKFIESMGNRNTQQIYP